MFVLGENHFRKCFFGNAGVWLVRKIEFSENQFQLTKKNTLWPWKWISVPIFTSNEFRTERERERESKRKKRRTSSSSPVRWLSANLELQFDDRTHQSHRSCWSHRAARSRELQSDDRTATIAPSISPPRDLPFDPPISLSVWFWFLLLLWWCGGGVLVVVAFDCRSLLPWVELPCENFVGK